MTTPNGEAMRMDAYYYGFDSTGVEAIDKILSAVACAGKAYHHTESWNDTNNGAWPPHTGNSPADWIQNAANEAAKALTPRPEASARREDLVRRIDALMPAKTPAAWWQIAPMLLEDIRAYLTGHNPPSPPTEAGQ